MKSRLYLYLVITSFLSIIGVSQAHAQWTNGQDATYVIGQPDFTSSTENSGGPSASSLDSSVNVVIDYDHNKMYVVDMDNHRILRFAYPVENIMPTAEAVLGQPDFTTITPNTGGIGANTLNEPMNASVGENGTLWVAEFGNSRVLRYDNAHLKDNGADADGVLGQPDFTSSADNNGGIGANTLWGSISIRIGSDGRIWVADFNNHRVLRYDNAASKPNGASADGVLGQPDFISNIANNGGTDAHTMHRPASVFEDMNGNLWVADRNNRVLKFENAANAMNGADADVVIGQTNFMTSTSGSGPDKFHNTTGTFVDSRDNLYVQDLTNNRVLIFQEASQLSNGASASFVLGQPDFSTTSEGTTAAKLATRNFGNNVFVDLEQSILWVGDNVNNRILGFEASENLGPDIVPIPTLGQWAIIILILAFFVLGVLRLQDQNKPSTSF